jgi:hypothetical protein
MILLQFSHISPDRTSGASLTEIPQYENGFPGTQICTLFPLGFGFLSVMFIANPRLHTRPVTRKARRLKRAQLKASYLQSYRSAHDLSCFVAPFWVDLFAWLTFQSFPVGRPVHAPRAVFWYSLVCLILCILRCGRYYTGAIPTHITDIYHFVSLISIPYSFCTYQ